MALEEVIHVISIGESTKRELAAERLNPGDRPQVSVKDVGGATPERFRIQRDLLILPVCQTAQIQQLGIAVLHQPRNVEELTISIDKTHPGSGAMGKPLDDDAQAPAAVDRHVRTLKTRFMKPRRISLKTALSFQEAEETLTNLLKPLLGIWFSDVLAQSGSRAQPLCVPKSAP